MSPYAGFATAVTVIFGIFFAIAKIEGTRFALNIVGIVVLILFATAGMFVFWGVVLP